MSFFLSFFLFRMISCGHFRIHTCLHRHRDHHDHWHTFWNITYALAHTHTDWCRSLASIKYQTSHAFHISYTNDGDALYVLVDYLADRIYCLSTMPMKSKRFEYFPFFLAILLLTRNGSQLNNKMKIKKSDYIEPVHNANMHCNCIQGLWMHTKFHINMLIISVSSPLLADSLRFCFMRRFSAFFLFSLYNNAIWAQERSMSKREGERNYYELVVIGVKRIWFRDRDMKWNNKNKTKWNLWKKLIAAAA